MVHTEFGRLYVQLPLAAVRVSPRTVQLLSRIGEAAAVRTLAQLILMTLRPTRRTAPWRLPGASSAERQTERKTREDHDLQATRRALRPLAARKHR